MQAVTMESTAIQRHKTAIRRGDFSRPVKCLLRDGLVGKEATFFDYGCGRGEDVELLAAKELHAAAGTRPIARTRPRQEADVVNLGYVINVIENPEERAGTLRRAWGLCRQLLAVSAQVLMAGRGKEPVEFGDGVLTGRGTFQKFFEQDELKTYLEAQLETEAIPAGIGTFYLFKDEGKTPAVPRQPLPPAGDSAPPPHRRAAAGGDPAGPGAADGGHRRAGPAAGPDEFAGRRRSSSGSAR